MVIKEQSMASALESLHMMLDASVDCIKLIDCDGNLQKINRAGCEALGVPLDSPLGMQWLHLLPTDVRATARRAMKLCMEKGRVSSFTGKIHPPGSPPVYWSNVLNPLKDENQQVISILCVSRNVTRQRVIEQKLRLASDFDPLSEAPNRRYLTRKANLALRTQAKKGGSVGVIVLDVDHFKAINDHSGHEAGDAVIKHIAHSLQRKLSKGEFLARLGGDEFAILISQLEGPEHMIDVARRCMKATEHSVHYKRQTIPFKFSMGAAYAPAQDVDFSILLRNADRALYQAKAEGRGRFCMAKPFTPEIQEDRALLATAV